jgi:hypothetical protein
LIYNVFTSVASLRTLVGINRIEWSTWTGLRTHTFTQQEKNHLDQGILGELQDEDKLLNVFIDRVFSSMQHEKMNYERYVVGLRAISLAIGHKAALQRSRKDIYEKLTSIEQAMQELKDIPPEEDWPGGHQTHICEASPWDGW